MWRFVFLGLVVGAWSMIEVLSALFLRGYKLLEVVRDCDDPKT